MPSKTVQTESCLRFFSSGLLHSCMVMCINVALITMQFYSTLNIKKVLHHYNLNIKNDLHICIYSKILYNTYETVII